VLAILLVFVRPALGDCVLRREPPYQLKLDTVDWPMHVSSGQTCIFSLRSRRVTIEATKLISPPDGYALLQAIAQPSARATRPEPTGGCRWARLDCSQQVPPL
jgi:hypothetical protein